MSQAQQNPSMATLDPVHKEEIRAGLLVTVSFVALIGLLFTAGNFTFSANARQVPIYFNFIGGLEENAPVQFAGHKVGKVSRISYLKKEEKIRVDVSISKEVELKKDSEAFIDTLGFMGEKLVELSPGSHEAQPLAAGESIQGTDPVAMMKVIKESTELLQEFEKVNHSLQAMVSDLGGIVKENRSEMDETFANLRDTSQNLKEMTEDLKHHPWKLLRKSKEKKK